MKEIMAVYDRDYPYAERLCKTLNAIDEFPLTAMCFRSKEELQVFSGTEKPGVLLIEEQDADEEVRRMNAGQVLYLSDLHGYPSLDRVPTIYKYQPVHLIGAEIAKLQHVVESEFALTEKPIMRTRYLAVHSPIHRSLKTSFSLIFGQLLSQTSKVLYMNFETLSGFSALFEKEFRYDLSDMLYAYETGETDREFTESFHGLDILAPSAVPEDIYKTDPEVMKNAVMEYAKKGDYDAVILDLGTDLRIAEAFLPYVRKIYVPTVQDTFQMEKIAEYQSWVERVGGENARGKIEEIILPAARTFASGKNYLEQLLWSEFGDYIRKMLGGTY